MSSVSLVKEWEWDILGGDGTVRPVQVYSLLLETKVGSEQFFLCIFDLSASSAYLSLQALLSPFTDGQRRDSDLRQALKAACIAKIDRLLTIVSCCTHPNFARRSGRFLH